MREQVVRSEVSGLAPSEQATPLRFVDLQEVLSLSRGWEVGEWNGQETLRAPFGGNEVRFLVQGPSEIRLTIVTEAYVWLHLFIDGQHVSGVPPENSPSRVVLPVDAEKGSEVRIVRTSVSSGPFYVDAHLVELDLMGGGQITGPRTPVASKVFCTFGDSISGNCCINPEPPFDPYGIGYGWQVCEHFNWQYLNAARDGSGLCRRLFDNPLARERVEKEVTAFRPDYLLLFYGTNDLGAQVDSVQEFAPAFDHLVNTLVSQLPGSRIACLALLWRYDAPEESARHYNRIILHTCEKYGIPCEDPFEWLGPESFHDGLHPNRKGHRQIAERIIRFFESTFSELRRTAQESDCETS